ncbi:conserved hypothetical protein [Histoplasma capsulatum var. duboisii H88]|uniref:BTB/POZ domain-containing protein n=1 Tax=Ajellomyces capsulatus (strain H88) TaxID=544711 RepID=F0UF63_AJEC8|nr:conserved hypothetical protein [Histoplasma capsulatum var. duboisii H88]QSS54865.1 BTB/POZ domain-containing protein [Histoplasma capsulatum var. duboisii H88]
MSDSVPSERFAELMISGKYSDLVLECQGKQFRVHRAIVCGHSPVLAAACDSDFKEAVTNTIQITGFDVETAKQMVNFMYTGDYDEDVEGGQSTIPSDGESHTDEPQSPRMDQLLSHHIQINTIADYYDVAKLRELSNSRIQEILTTSWSPHGFGTAIEEALRSTGDKKLHEILAESAAARIETLVDANENITSEDFAQSVICKVVDLYKKANEELKQQLQLLGNKLSIAQSDIETAVRVKKDFDNCIQLLQQTKYCRNINCDADFSCYFEDTGHWNNVHILRCSKCQCRHKS